MHIGPVHDQMINTIYICNSTIPCQLISQNIIISLIFYDAVQTKYNLIMNCWPYREHLICHFLSRDLHIPIYKRYLLFRQMIQENIHTFLAYNYIIKYSSCKNECIQAGNRNTQLNSVQRTLIKYCICRSHVLLDLQVQCHKLILCAWCLQGVYVAVYKEWCCDM